MNNNLTDSSRLRNETRRSNYWTAASLLRWPLLLLIAICLPSCEQDGAAIAESQYEATLVGEWQGTVGDEKETIRFQSDGSFSAQLLETGFISNTLGQGTVGTIRGTWTLRDKVISLSIESTENVQTLNMATSSTIVTFKQNQLVVSSAGGGTSTFTRAVSL